MTLRLKCLIEGEYIVFPVTVARNEEVSDLKKVIQHEGGPLKDVHPYYLELWKVSAIDESLYEMTLLFSAQGLQPHRRQG